MNHKVHHIAGLVAAEGALITFHQPAFSLATFCGIFGGYFLSMAPDLDHSDSFISRHQPFRIISMGLEAVPFIKHRGFTHSLVAIVLLFFLLQLLPIPEVLIWCFLVAYASHIFLDLFTAGGVQLLFPLSFRFQLLPSFLAVSSDDNSFGQALLHFLFTGVFYFLGFHLLVDLLSFVPWAGGWLQSMWYEKVLGHLPLELRSWLN